MVSQDNSNKFRDTESANALREPSGVACLPGSLGSRVKVRAAAPTTDLLVVRLPLEDLHSGSWISTREGDAERLWVVQLVTPGAGDGCVELALVPHRL